MNAMILKLDVAGRPVRWVSRQEGALLYCRDQVAWEAGHEVIRLYGGNHRKDDRTLDELGWTLLATEH